MPFADLRTGHLATAELVQTNSKAGMQRGPCECCSEMKAKMMYTTHDKRIREYALIVERSSVASEAQSAAEALDHWQYRAQPGARESHKNHTSPVLMYRYMCHMYIRLGPYAIEF